MYNEDVWKGFEHGSFRSRSSDLTNWATRAYERIGTI